MEAVYGKTVRVGSYFCLLATSSSYRSRALMKLLTCTGSTLFSTGWEAAVNMLTAAVGFALLSDLVSMIESIITC